MDEHIEGDVAILVIAGGNEIDVRVSFFLVYKISFVFQIKVQTCVCLMCPIFLCFVFSVPFLQNKNLQKKGAAFFIFADCHQIPPQIKTQN